MLFQHHTAFTEEEKDRLTKDGWEVNGYYANKGWHRIHKLYDDEFEVDTMVTDEEDGYFFWEFDSGWNTLEQAIRHGKDA